MGLGAFDGASDNHRRGEILNWFLLDERFPEDRIILEIGQKLTADRLAHSRSREIYAFPGVGRQIYIAALTGFIQGQFNSHVDFPDWLSLLQSELADWLRSTPRRKRQYFLDMANLQSYHLLPHAWANPRG
jgi:hypothetical protein